MTLPRPESRLQSLPPILRKQFRKPMPSCSKAPRGLSVLPRVTCIFTGIAVSPSICPRQRPTRYAIRAGRNLPDKEFRYLRTVIVTAAVYRGFNSRLAPILLTFRHRAGVSLGGANSGIPASLNFSSNGAPDRGSGQWLAGSLTGAVASQKVTEAPKGSLSLDGNQAQSAMA